MKISSRTRVARLARVFRYGKSLLLNKIARLSVIYEDLRVEMGELTATQKKAEGSELDHWDMYRFIYFLRRAANTTLEYRGGLNRIMSSAEFKAAEPFLTELDSTSIRDANVYLEKHIQRIKAFRNALGGHVQQESVDWVIENLDEATCGSITWRSPEHVEIGGLALELGYAGQLVAGSIHQLLNPTKSLDEELKEMLEVLIGSYNKLQMATYSLVHAFLWDRFGK